MSMTPADKVAAYIKLRDYKKAAQDEFAKSLERTNQALEKLEADLLQHLIDTGASSLACSDGTVYRKTEMSVTVEDRAAFRSFVEDNGAWEAMDMKANKTFIREFMEEKKQPVPGVKVTQMNSVGIRRS